MSILRALTSGYTPHLILNSIINKFPQHASKIRTAQAAGYGADVILKHVIDKKDPEYEDTERYLTDHEKTRKNDARHKREAASQVIGMLGTAGALAAGGYALYNADRSIRPDQILPAQRNSPRSLGGTTLQGSSPRGPNPNLPGQKPRQLGYQPRQLGAPQQSPRQPQAPQNPNAPITQPPQFPDLDKNVNLVRNLQVEPTFQTIIKNGMDVVTTAQVLKQVLPKSKIAILEKTRGGLEGLVADYTRYMQDNPPAVKQQFNPLQQQNNPNLPTINEQMQGQNQTPQAQQQPIEQGLEQAQELPMNEGQNAPFIPNEEPINQRIDSVKSQLGQSQRPAKEINPQSFSIPGYKHASETSTEYVNRKKINDTIQTAAKMLANNKTFLDLPLSKEATFSTAADVLRFLGGIPNVYDPLLEDEEKEALTNALLESGQMSSEDFTPDSGSRDVYGAQMTPNLIWNLLLAINPKIKSLAPPSIKGSKGKPPGSKMGTTELRRFLTHGVYGALSGKNISFDLADKIEKISRASSSLDIIANAAKSGNMRAMEEEMDKIMKDDAYFLELMDIELEDMLMTSDQKQMKVQLDKEDTKNAASLKASRTKKLNKERSDGNERSG